ncbi:MAG: hypothetical protein ABWU13_14955, partial [Limnospira maxima]
RQKSVFNPVLTQSRSPRFCHAAGGLYHCMDDQGVIGEGSIVMARPIKLTTPRAKATGIPRRDFRTSDKSDS